MKFALLTSGGDAPGMNAALRAAVRLATDGGDECLGVRDGYKGLLLRDFIGLTARSVSGIMQLGGTMLRSARSEEFRDEAAQRKAARLLDGAGVDALIVIGGDGTFRGAEALSRFWRGRVFGIPGTIDNDIAATSVTIGFDTAVNTAMQAIDKIRDTAAAHERVFLIEVMGRTCGWIALHAGLASGAEEILVPEIPFDLETAFANILEGRKRGKRSSIIVMAEGHRQAGDAPERARGLQSKSGVECRAVERGYLQRGGPPTAADRILATQMGAFAVRCLRSGESGKMAAWREGRLLAEPFAAAWAAPKPLAPFLVEILPALAEVRRALR